MRVNVILAFLVGVLGYYYRSLHRYFFEMLGFGKVLSDVGIENCNTLFRDKIEGCEDMRNVGDKVLMTCGHVHQRHQVWFPPIGVRNALKKEGTKIEADSFYMFDPKTKDLNKLSVKGYQGDLVLHGISITVQGDQFTLAAVNHRRTGSCISMFAGSSGESILTHIETVCHPLIHAPNSVVLTGEGFNFYTTNDHTNLDGIGRMVEDFLRTPTTNVVYCQGKKDKWDCRIVADKMVYANGINISKDGKQVYVASSTRGEVYIFDRNLKSNDLTLVQTVELDQGLDNITVDENGELLVAGFPSLLKYLDWAKDPLNPSKFCPGGAVKLVKDKNGSFVPHRVYLDSQGKYLSGTTVALKSGNNLLLGGVKAKGIVMC